MSQPFGFRVVGNLTGAENRCQRYQLNSSSNRVFAGDLMVLDAAGNAARAASSATSAGPFLGVAAEDSPATLVAGGNISICDDPNAVFAAVSTAAIARAAINLNYKASVADGNTTLRMSQCRLGVASTASDGIKVIGVVDRPDNSINTAGQELLCIINNHYFKGASAGV